MAVFSVWIVLEPHSAGSSNCDCLLAFFTQISANAGSGIDASSCTETAASASSEHAILAVSVRRLLPFKFYSLLKL
jgi:hypothetical protein